MIQPAIVGIAADSVVAGHIPGGSSIRQAGLPAPEAPKRRPVSYVRRFRRGGHGICARDVTVSRDLSTAGSLTIAPLAKHP